jgi:serine/threonine-protein kinase
MNEAAAQWPRLLELFGRLTDAEPAERARLLGELARDEPALHARVLHLLALDASDSDLAADVSGWRDRLIAHEEPDTPPERIGAWRIVRELGAGGMGRVFLAERADGAYEQQVALKLVLGEFSTDAAVARFLVERRILARLDHPGIATLVDGGVDANGRPWFAMQYVDGVPLPDHANTHASRVEDRLKLFAGVCDAVAYAHRQLVVHCDLKPSNVLIDRSGQPRLLDFGISRLLGTDESGESTHTSARALTPGYAAPEQLAGGPLGIATDVYALGVMLHELLVGKRPYAATGDSPSALAVAHSHGEPPLASRAATTASPLPPRRLRGDLDLIIATALRHDPAQRYAGADALADDLRRHLSGWPLRAQRDSATHRVRKFVARHRVAVPLAVLAVLALLATTAFALMQTHDARRQTVRAESVRNFLLDLFEQADPDTTSEHALTARELIDLGAKRVQAELGDEPDTRIELLGVVGNLYQSLGAFDAAADIRVQRLAQAEQRYAPDDMPLAQARVDAAQSAGSREKFDHARQLLQAAIDTAARNPQANWHLLSDALGVLGWVEQLSGRYEQAAATQNRRVALLRAAPPQAAFDLASALDDLGAVQHLQGLYEECEKNHREALAIAEALPDAKPSALLKMRYDLAVVEREHAHFDAAEALFKQNLDTARRVYGDTHRNVADQLFQLGQTARQSGREEQSLPYLQQALTIYERSNGARHSSVATALTSLAQAQLRTGARAEAIANLERAYAIYLDTLGPRHLYAAVGETALAQAKLESGDARGAEASFRDALAKYADANPDHIYAEAVRKGLGEALTAQHRYAEAEPLLRGAFERISMKFGRADYRSEGAAIALANCLHQGGRTAEATAMLADTRRAIEQTPATAARARNLEKLEVAEATLQSR